MIFEVNPTELENKIPQRPPIIQEDSFRYDSFGNGEVLLNKKKDNLPAMGWNSWNAFGSNNSEALTKAMADKFIELGLDELGYQYIVLDDGCYYSKRVDGKLSNEKVKFPSGFKSLSDYIHAKGLKFGMYNDIGTNLCAGAAVGTCGFEQEDAKTYVEWGVDFLKVDNCYYLWDNATFSESENLRYVYAPEIQSIQLKGLNFKNKKFDKEFDSIENGSLRGKGAKKNRNSGTISGIGTFDGTGPHYAPVGDTSGELAFNIDVPCDGDYKLTVFYKADKIEGCGSWLQIGVGEGENTQIYYDDLVPVNYDIDKVNQKKDSNKTYVKNAIKSIVCNGQVSVELKLTEGRNVIRLMNHRRQENTLYSYAKLLEGLNKAKPEHEIVYSICEWGKTQPQNWAYKVGDSWRILNDITFAVGNNGDYGRAEWKSGYTNSVTSQYNKAVIMDEFSGLDKGWNDPDMLMIGMNGLNLTQCKTHFAMWCMMNSPLMLGLDLRRIEKGDDIYKIITNEKMIALNQDELGVQAKRIYCSKVAKNSDRYYTKDIDRVDILAKPLADGSVALSFINVSENKKNDRFKVSKYDIIEKIGSKMIDKELFALSSSYSVMDCNSGKTEINSEGVFFVENLSECDSVTVRITPMETKRKNAAKEVHKYLQNVLQEPDEKDVKKAEVLKDLYDCHACVEDIAQVYVKGIMNPVRNKEFGNKDILSQEEAELIFQRILDKSSRERP